MKKILLSVVAMAVMSVSAFALDGKIGTVNFAANGKVWVTIVPADASAEQTKELASSGDVKKAMTAAVLTAKSTNADVIVYQGTVDGITGWQSIQLK